jgi:hypothetical protein
MRSRSGGCRNEVVRKEKKKNRVAHKKKKATRRFRGAVGSIENIDD